MYLAFYKASTGTIYDRLVDLCSGRNGYSHTELVFDDGAFFSSSPRDGGCRFKMIPVDDHWDLVWLPFTPDQEEVIRDICHTYCWPRRFKYDWAGVFRFVFRWLPIKMSRHRQFCSEVCTRACQFRDAHGFINARYDKISLFDWADPRKVSPNDLYEMAVLMLGDRRAA